jgi:hypothetical protein
MENKHQRLSVTSSLGLQIDSNGKTNHDQFIFHVKSNTSFREIQGSKFPDLNSGGEGSSITYILKTYVASD